jgi:CRISPR/Cas system CSM-associated protein Csm3 (group 7 of RAMP superfamily)
MSEKNGTKGWHIARITIEAVSPISCGAGQGPEAYNALARDANGLPTIPGATLQGLLRAACPEDIREELFGAKSGADKITPARLIFSNAMVHGADNKAVCFHANLADPVLKYLSQGAPLKRDHVRLDERHSAAKGGKFERASVPIGTRFSFEVLLHGDSDEGEKLDKALSALKSPVFRVGSSSSRGYGKLKVRSAKRGYFAPSQAEKFRNFRSTSLDNHTELKKDCTLAKALNPLTISLKLRPINPWRTGQDGVRTQTSKRDNGKEANFAPLREGQTTWEHGGKWNPPSPDAEAKDDYVLPGSSLRGPLAHRALFHWNAQNGQFIDTADPKSLEKLLENKSHLNAIFGVAREAGDGESGQVSALIFDDVKLTFKTVQAVDHNKIDRFTGGVFQGALYGEELITTEELGCSITLRPNRIGAICEKARAALLLALSDLINGRLALGAKSYGFCSGSVEFDGEGSESWKEAWTALAKEPTPIAEEAMA